MVTSQPSGVDESISDGTEKKEEYWPQSLEISLQLPSYSHPDVSVLEKYQLSSEYAYLTKDLLFMNPNSKNCYQCNCTDDHNEITPSPGLSALVLYMPIVKLLSILIALRISFFVISGEQPPSLSI